MAEKTVSEKERKLTETSTDKVRVFNWDDEYAALWRGVGKSGDYTRQC
jgi:hypothetical protein